MFFIITEWLLMIFSFFLKLLLFLFCWTTVICWVTNDFYAIHTYFISPGNNIHTNTLGMEWCPTYRAILWKLPSLATFPYRSLCWRKIAVVICKVSLLPPVGFGDVMLLTCIFWYIILYCCTNIIATRYLFMFAAFVCRQDILGNTLKNTDFEALIIVSIWINGNSFDMCKEGNCLIAPELSLTDLKNCFQIF